MEQKINKSPLLYTTDYNVKVETAFERLDIFKCKVTTT